MRKTAFLRSTLRQPIRSLFLLLLAGAISFAFTFRIGEYALVDRETARLSVYYRSIGRLENQRGSNNEDDVATYLSTNPNVEFVNRMTHASGVLQDDIYNAEANSEHNYGPVDSWNDVFFYGTLIDPVESEGGYYYRFQVDEVLAGYPENICEGIIVSLAAEPGEEGDPETLEEIYHSLEMGGRYLIRATYARYDTRCFETSSYRQLIAKALTDTREHKKQQLFKTSIYWEQYYMQEGETCFLPVPTDLDLTKPEYTAIYRELQAVKDNQHAVGVMGITDVSAYSDLQEESRLYNLLDGRWPNNSDNAMNRHVCAISQELAETRGIQVGDTVSITLRDVETVKDGRTYSDLTNAKKLFPMSGGWVYNPVELLEGYEYSGERITNEYEVVGIYYSIDPMSTRYLFVPLSSIPQTWSRPYGADGFVLVSSQAETAFMTEVRDDLLAFGWIPFLYENNGAGFFAAANEMIDATRNNTVIFGLILIAVFVLTNFIYFRFRRRDLAISRALGVPAGRCVVGLALPLVLVGGIGIIGGAALAWSYTRSHAGELLGAITAAAGVGEAAVTLSSGSLVLLCAALLLALLALALLFAAVTVKKPVLALLQGGKSKK